MLVSRHIKQTGWANKNRTIMQSWPCAHSRSVLLIFHFFTAQRCNVSAVLGVTLSEILKVKTLWLISRMVQGQPKSKITVPIDSAWMVLYSSFIDPVIVSVTVFEIFHAKFLRPWIMRVHGHTGSKFIVPKFVSYLTSFESTIVSLTVYEIFNIKAIFP